MPRPTKYTEAIADRIVELVGNGASREDSAMACGINVETLYSWMRRKAAFSERVHEADAKFATSCEIKVGKKDPLRWLQAKRQKVWGNLGKSQVELTGPDGGPIKTEHEHRFSEETVLECAKYIRDRGSSEGEGQP